MKRIIVALTFLLFSQLTLAQVLLLDVRSQGEFDEGHAYGAVHIPYQQISEKAPTLLTDKQQKIKVYCKAGGRAEKAKKSLEALGYTNVENIRTLENAKQYAPQ